MNKSLMNIAAAILLTSSFMFAMKEKEVKPRKIKKHDKEITIYPTPIVEEITVDEESQKPALPKSASESESLVVPAAEQYYDAAETTNEEKQVITEEKKQEEPAVYEQPIGPEPKPAVSKSTFITSWMKTKCLGASNLTKAQYYLENTANRDPQTRKEIGSRIGDAISDTIEAIKKLDTKEKDIQVIDRVLTEKQKLMDALSKIILQAVIDKIEVNAEYLAEAGKALQELNQGYKVQSRQVMSKYSQTAKANKKAALALQKHLRARNNFKFESLSDRTYEDGYDLISDEE